MFIVSKNTRYYYKKQTNSFLVPIKISTFALDLSKQRLERACVMAN